MKNVDYADINIEKYANKRYNIHTVTDPGKAEQKDEKEIEKRNKNKDVCLECIKKKCSGTEKCFEKERRNKNAEGS